MIITIEGGVGEGKTLLAKEICKGRRASFLDANSIRSLFWSSQVSEDSDIVVIDNVHEIGDLKTFFSNDKFVIEKPAAPSVEIKTPDLILVMD